MGVALFPCLPCGIPAPCLSLGVDYVVCSPLVGVAQLGSRRGGVHKRRVSVLFALIARLPLVFIVDLSGLVMFTLGCHLRRNPIVGAPCPFFGEPSHFDSGDPLVIVFVQMACCHRTQMYTCGGRTTLYHPEWYCLVVVINTPFLVGWLPQG